jgi:predicted DNA-binding transcriptional regulator AlpA
MRRAFGPACVNDYARYEVTKTPERGERLLDKSQICKIANVTYPTVWAWMRQGKFPRARVVGGKSMWLTSEVDAWLAKLPVRPLKGDAGSAY